jgi:hypothetical protein
MFPRCFLCCNKLFRVFACKKHISPDTPHAAWRQTNRLREEAPHAITFAPVHHTSIQLGKIVGNAFADG